MKPIGGGVLLLLLLLSGCRSGGPVLRNEADSLSYVLGMNVAENLRQRDSTLNVEALCTAIRDVYRDRPRMTMAEAADFYRIWYNVTRPERIREASVTFVEAADTVRGVRATASGLRYRIENEGDGPHPAATDTVVVRFTGWLRTGAAVAEGRNAADTVRLPLVETIPGWREGVGLIGKGGTIRLWIPPELAYGRSGNATVGPNEAIRYDVELLDILPGPVPDESL